MRWLGLPDPRSPFSPLANAATYDAFVAAARARDEESGAARWRAIDESSLYDADALRTHLASLVRLRESGDAIALAELLEEALYRHQGDLADPRLYDVALLGTKSLVERFWDEIERAIDWLADPEASGVPPEAAHARFVRHRRVFGRSALLLSGGASLGFFHLGVVKALLAHGLLPSVLSGASMGAMVACGIGARDDAALRALFADLSVLRTDALAARPMRAALREGSVFDPARLREVILHNNGDLTFAEAHARSGRTVCVSVSPARDRQKPRILCHVNAPDVTLLSAALASSAVPGAFPPVVLERRGPDGAIRPSMGTERWIDGTFQGDVPTRRLGRLLNVNHFVVSQVNPHVAPVKRIVRNRGLVPFVLDAAVTSVRVRAASDLGLVRRALAPTPLSRPLHLAHTLVDQSYGGDIDIHPRLRPIALARAFANLSHAELERHVLEGERATWPLLARIRDQTRVERSLERAVRALAVRTGQPFED